MTTQIIERQNTAATQTVNPFSGAAATASAIPQADNPLAASDAARAQLWLRARPTLSPEAALRSRDRRSASPRQSLKVGETSSTAFAS